MAIHKVKTVTQNGEVTVNINLRIELGSDGLNISVPGGDGSDTSKSKFLIQDQDEFVERSKGEDVVPDELFDDLPSVENFGEGDGD